MSQEPARQWAANEQGQVGYQPAAGGKESSLVANIYPFALSEPEARTCATFIAQVCILRCMGCESALQDLRSMMSGDARVDYKVWRPLVTLRQFSSSARLRTSCSTNNPARFQQDAPVKHTACLCHCKIHWQTVLAQTLLKIYQKSKKLGDAGHQLCTG